MHKHKTQSNKRPPCPACQQIRRFLLLAALILLLMWSKPDLRVPAWLDLTTLVGDLFLLAFVLLFGYKLWQHYRNKP
jgi:hypothetical protein